ncbi:MAG: YbjN domain-containing protein [Candidatus Latescibacteria bacterium]|nr:YbjN domain-containing protein [Candidatus Latescibacterota bacterium]
MKTISVRTTTDQNLIEFLGDQEYEVTEAGAEGGLTVYAVRRSEEEQPVFMWRTDGLLAFRAVLGADDNIPEEKRSAFYRKALDVNTEIKPLAVGLDTESDPAIFVVEAALTYTNLDASEVLSLLNAFDVHLETVVNPILEEFL